MNVKCRCGQSYAVGGGPFPRKISCYACGNKLTVLDGGEILEQSTKPAGSVEAPPKSDQIQAMPPSISSSAISSAPLPGEQSKPTPRADNILVDPEVLEYQWKAERGRHAILTVFGVDLVPTRLMAVLFGSSSLGICVSAMAILGHLEMSVPANYYILVVGILFAMLSLYLYRRGEQYDRAETDWRERVRKN